MTRDLLRSSKWAIPLMAGVLLFCAGLLILRHNPYWRYEEGQPGIIDHRVYAWSTVGHFTTALGLFSVVLSIAVLVSRLFSGRWSRLYWIAVALGGSLWWGRFGVESTYGISYAWDRKNGVTEFLVVEHSLEKQPNWLSRHIIRWQVEPELINWLEASRLNRTHGGISVRVVSIVPIASPTLDCDCVDCCKEEGQSTNSTR